MKTQKTPRPGAAFTGGRERGFTLLEIMVAISIIAIVVVGIYKLHAQTVQMNIDAKFYATAPFLAQKKLAEMESAGLEDAASDGGDFEGRFSDYSWQVTVDGVASEALGSASEDMRRVDIAVGYHDGMTYRLRTYRFVRKTD